MISQYDLILSPVVSEKAMNVQASNCYVFKVASSANKFQIKSAIQKIFSVEVKKISVLNVKGKTKVFKQTVGKRSDWKKAYVTLKDGFKLDFNELG